MIATTVSAQSVSWKSSVQHLDGQTYRIVLEASIPAPWHMYDMGPYEGGPNATTITFTPGEGAVLEVPGGNRAGRCHEQRGHQC